MPTPTHIRKILKLAVMGTAVILLEITAVWWLGREISRRVGEIQQSRAQVRVLKEARLNYAIFKRDYEKVRDFIPRLESALPRVEDLFGIVASLDQMATRTGNRQTLAVEGFEPQRDAAGVSFVPFSAGLEGSYQSLRTYLRELAAAPVFVRVDSVNVSAPQTIVSETKIQITGKIFLR